MQRDHMGQRHATASRRLKAETYSPAVFQALAEVRKETEISRELVNTTSWHGREWQLPECVVTLPMTIWNVCDDSFLKKKAISYSEKIQGS